ncbi:MAG TPA: SH3 domain-containing protein, partial [Synergistales bacterium]|nr:SH3 domain-containing protein [Synergistales bacterium]
MKRIHSFLHRCKKMWFGGGGAACALAFLCCAFFPGLTGAHSAWALAGLEVPQSPMYHAASFMDEPLITAERHQELYRRLKEQFYSPWTQTAPRQATEVLEWVFDRYGVNVYGENLQPRSAAWIEEQRRQARLDAVGELNRHAVSVRPTSLRLMPTETPAFRSPELAGEGYPFDYLQNSAVHPGEPLFVSHLSLD